MPGDDTTALFHLYMMRRGAIPPFDGQVKGRPTSYRRLATVPKGMIPRRSQPVDSSGLELAV